MLGIGVLASGAMIASVLYMRKINRYVAIISHENILNLV